MRNKLAATLGLALFLGSSLALAEDPAPAQKKGVLILPKIVLKGRLPRPNVAIDVARVQPQLGVDQLHQGFVDRIAQGANKDAF